MDYAPNTAPQAVARARRFEGYLPFGMCCNFVWNCITSGVKRYGLPDANSAWARATMKETSRTPPAGAPVYWAVGQYGHIAISVGGGRVRSTDYPFNGQVGECTLAQMETRWRGMTYRGWSRDFAGDLIQGLEKPAPAPTPAPVPGSSFGSMAPIRMDMSKGIKLSALKPGAVRDPHVARLQSAIWNWRSTGFRTALVKGNPNLRRADLYGGNYGPITRWMVQDCYRLLIEMEGAAKWGKPSDTPGPMLLKRLGFTHIY